MASKERFFADLSTEINSVTGSKHLAVVRLPNGERIKFLVDCGQFLGEDDKYNYLPFTFDSEDLSFVLITHSHIDHIGMLPLLVKKGYRGKIYTSEDTKVLLPYALEDTCKVLGENAKRNRRPKFYTDTDVETTISHVCDCPMNVPIYTSPYTKVFFFKNAHLVGATMILVIISYPGYEDINLLFMGDYNNKNVFLDSEELPDWVKELRLTVIAEATYGCMVSSEVTTCFGENICRAARDGKIIHIPVLAVGRTQEALYFIRNLQKDRFLSTDVSIFYDGKLGMKNTKLFTNGSLHIKESMRDFLPQNLTWVDKTIRQALIEDNGCKIILSTSGMGSYGPSRMYIPAFVERPNALIHFTCYTTPTSLGGKLKQAGQNEKVEIAGMVVRKKAEVKYTTEFSSHSKADVEMEFLKKFKRLQCVLVTHGENESKEMFASRILDNVHTKNVCIFDRRNYFRIGPYGLIKTHPAKFPIL